jgi:alanyl-tRNA synthetase
VTEDVRVVVIGDFDVTPCGGTHCARTAQIGLVRVSGVERHKGGTRVTFDAGPRARAGLVSEASVLRAIGKDFTCGPSDVPGAIDRLRRELGEAREGLGQTRAKLADAIADGLVAAGDPKVVAAIDGAPVETLRAIATRVTAREDAVALLAGPNAEGTAVVVARGAKSDFDCGAFVKRAAASAGGRGGGRPERAEGRLPPGVDWRALVASILRS